MLAIGSVAFIGALFLVALFFQDGLGLSALQSGLNTFPEAIGVMAGAQMVTRLLYPSSVPAGSWSAASWCWRACMSLAGARRGRAPTCGGSGSTCSWPDTRMSHVFVPSQAAGFATISPANTGRASTLFNAVRQLGSAFGVALLTTVMAAVGPTHVVGRPLVPT